MPIANEERPEWDDGSDVEKSTNKDRSDEHLSRTKSAISIAETLSLPREIAFVGVICMANFMTRSLSRFFRLKVMILIEYSEAALGQVLSILHIIGDSFGITDPGVLSWLIAGYSLTVGTFILISGRLGDAFGHKRLLLIGFAWFSVWSMVCGLAVYSNHVLFVFARVLQGIGPAIALPNSLAILGVTYAPGKRKAMVFSIFGAMAPNGSIAGSLFAGIFGQLAWWPWAFWALAIALAIITVLGYFAIPEPPKDALAKMPLSQKIRELDLEGATVGITALILINFAWNQAPIVGWDKAYIIVTLILGIALLPLFFYIELRWAKQPLIPKDCLTTTVGFVLASSACGWACFGIWAYYIWQYVEVLRGIGPILASAWVHLSFFPPSLTPPIQPKLIASTDLPRLRLRRHRRHSNRLAPRQSPSRRRNVHRPNLFHNRHNNNNDRAYPPNLLGPNIRLRIRNPLGNGYVLPRRNAHSQ